MSETAAAPASTTPVGASENTYQPMPIASSSTIRFFSTMAITSRRCFSR